jgi:hypothetical protein
VTAVVLVFGWGALLRSLPAAEPYLPAALPVGTALFAAWLCGYAATLTPRQTLAPVATRRFVNTRLAKAA